MSSPMPTTWSSSTAVVRRRPVDEGGDDQARADAQRGQDLAEGRPSGALHVPWLLVRSALVQSEWPMVPGHKPVQEERATAQDNSGQPAGARPQRPMRGNAVQL